MEIYNLVIPEDNLLRQIKEFVDFGFVYDKLIEKYCLDNGRNAVQYDMSFKYFLDMLISKTVQIALGSLKRDRKTIKVTSSKFFVLCSKFLRT